MPNSAPPRPPVIESRYPAIMHPQKKCAQLHNFAQSLFAENGFVCPARVLGSANFEVQS
jgi:hypothetical protein